MHRMMELGRTVKHSNLSILVHTLDKAPQDDSHLKGFYSFTSLLYSRHKRMHLVQAFLKTLSLQYLTLLKLLLVFIKTGGLKFEQDKIIS